MAFISEQQIDEAASALNDSEAAYQKALSSFQEKQPVLLSYFFTENFQAFTQAEKEYLLYLLLIIWEAFRRSGASAPLITEPQLAAAEEFNWNLMEQSRARGFHQRLDAFFHAYPQEDLLAFAEDALGEDEEEQIVTPEGREAMFICLKTAIDCLVQAPQPDMG